MEVKADPLEDVVGEVVQILLTQTLQMDLVLVEEQEDGSLVLFVRERAVDGAANEAVLTLRTAFRQGEAHALLAYELLRECSPQEFAYWRMERWQENG